VIRSFDHERHFAEFDKKTFVIIVTPRLQLRPLTWDDFEFIQALHADTDVARHISHGRPRTRAENERMMEVTLSAYREGLGHLGVELKTTGELVGRCGLNLLEVEASPVAGQPPRCYWGRGSAPAGMDTSEALEVGYTFARRAWGHGYATESAIAVRDMAFDSTKAARLLAIIFPANHASIRVAERIGMRPGPAVVAFDRPAVAHEISREDWSRINAPPEVSKP
jgi:RimJ/RimL family protein N-acetyltransferase